MAGKWIQKECFNKIKDIAMKTKLVPLIFLLIIVQSIGSAQNSFLSIKDRPVLSSSPEEKVGQEIQKNEWAPIGAEWHFDNKLQLPRDFHGYTHYKVLKDTIVNSRLVRMIEKQVVRPNGGIQATDTLYTYEENSKVYFLINGKFSMGYDFGAQVGDTIKLDPDIFNCDSVSPMIVDSIQWMKVNGVQLKIQFVSYKYLRKRYNNEKVIEAFTEKLGYYKDLIYHPACSPGDSFVFPYLRCYQDQSISYISELWQARYPNASCDALITAIDEKFSNHRVKIYPNPTTGIIQIETNDNISSLAIYDSRGSKTKYYLNDHLSSADLSSLPGGLYFIKIIFKNKECYNYSIIKR